jgi:hypothetical protein
MKWTIVLLDQNKQIAKVQPFVGTYNDARVYADQLLCSSEKYWGYRVDNSKLACNRNNSAEMDMFAVRRIH